ncbi:MAG: hypothetical protein RBT80_24300 [Candidatus Vecturithrix sp.]|jgi:uncharacterized protein (TIGR00725 family)|nr:hypothetical protein [Candidatus Vecturithrix sp.]
MVTGGLKAQEQALKIAYIVGQNVIFRKHTLISNGANGVDETSCKGAFMAARIGEMDAKNTIYIFRSQKYPDSLLDFGHIEIIGETPEERRAVVVEQSHAVIIIGGNKGTKSVVRQAQIMKKPIIPVRIREDNEISSIFWHKIYDQNSDSLPYIPIKKEDLQKIDTRQNDIEEVALSAVMIAENLVYTRNGSE